MTFPYTDTLLHPFAPVTLEGMESIRLMNRIDTKYLFPLDLIPDLLRLLSPYYRILEINGMRSFHYNTRYLDTDNMLFYIQHVTGKRARFKVRFRTYESTGDTYLEVKMKTNRNRTIKWRIKNNSPSEPLDETARLFLNKHVPLNSLNLRPTLDNMFIRVTLAGTDTNERVTIDTDMIYKSPEGAATQMPFLAVVELKSEGYPSLSPFVIAVRKMGIHPAGFSKYCMGNALIRDVPKKNVLKRKILLLNKIENEYAEFYAA